MKAPKFFTHVASRYRQLKVMDDLKTKKYYWDQKLSAAYCGVVLRKVGTNKIWVFGLDGSIAELKHE